MLLAIDTCLAQCSVALGDGANLLAERSHAMRRGHAEALLPMVDDVLQAAGARADAITRIVVTVGPGSFTGVRVGVAAARGLALARGCPAAGVTSLEALAAAARERCPGMPVLVVILGRGGQLYHQAFDAEGRPESPPDLGEGAEVAAKYSAREGVVAGSGCEAVTAGAAHLIPVLGLEAPPPAALLRLADTLDPARWREPPAPLYLRPPDAKPAAGYTQNRTG